MHAVVATSLMIFQRMAALGVIAQRERHERDNYETRRVYCHSRLVSYISERKRDERAIRDGSVTRVAGYRIWRGIHIYVRDDTEIKIARFARLGLSLSLSLSLSACLSLVDLSRLYNYLRGHFPPGQKCQEHKERSFSVARQKQKRNAKVKAGATRAGIDIGGVWILSPSPSPRIISRFGQGL